MSKARKRQRADIETRHEPSDGILPGRTKHIGTNDAGMKQVFTEVAKAAAQHYEKISSGRWLDEIEAEINRELPTIARDDATHRHRRRKYLQGALAELRQVRHAIKRGDDAMLIARHGFDLAIELERAGVVMFEQPAAKGRQGMIYWRGDWRDVSPLERRILKAIGNADRADLHAVYYDVWKNPYHNTNRGKVDKALATLNQKLAGVELHISKGEIIVTD